MSETNGKHERPRRPPGPAISFLYKEPGRPDRLRRVVPYGGRLAIDAAYEWVFEAYDIDTGGNTLIRWKYIAELYRMPDLTPPRARNLDGSLADGTRPTTEAKP